MTKNIAITFLLREKKKYFKTFLKTRLVAYLVNINLSVYLVNNVVLEKSTTLKKILKKRQKGF